MKSYINIQAILICTNLLAQTHAFILTSKPPNVQTSSFLLSTHPPSSTKALYAKSTDKKKNKNSTTKAAGLKGFGSTTKSSAISKITIEVDRSKAALNFYTFLENNGAGSNLKRVALGFFPLSSSNPDLKLRGVVALKTIQKGEIIIEIPYEAAWNLGRESSDPTLPGMMVLQEYCRWISSSSSSSQNDKDNNTGNRDLGPYLQMLPPFRSPDVLACTDFFSTEALEMLQSPFIMDETIKRKEKVSARFERDIEPMTSISSNMYRWSDGTAVTEEHLRWAVWLVTSRVLTVQGEAGTGESFRVMIPLIDMCNHDRSSPHILTGRAVPGGTLKVVAGKKIEMGEQINIVYGGGVSGNDRFIQDYGFIDNFCNGQADDISAKILLGKARILEGSGARGGRPTFMPEDEREIALAALSQTTLADDMSLLAEKSSEMADDVRIALEFRIGVKQALERFGYEKV